MALRGFVDALAKLLLVFLHAAYSVFLFACWLYENLQRKSPLPMGSLCKRIPKHILVAFIIQENCEDDEIEAALRESAQRIVRWCCELGISAITLYDCEGRFVKCSQNISDDLRSIYGSKHEDVSNSDIEYPLTPPPSDWSDSGSLSPEHGSMDHEDSVVTINIPAPTGKKLLQESGLTDVPKRGRRRKDDTEPLTSSLSLRLTSQLSSKPSLTSVARSLSQTEFHRRCRVLEDDASDTIFGLSIDDISSHLEGSDGLPSPDLAIMHNLSNLSHDSGALELHGLPPWQIRLTEIYYSRFVCRSSHIPSPWRTSLNRTQSPIPIGVLEFTAALQEYESAEFRLGK